MNAHDMKEDGNRNNPQKREAMQNAEESDMLPSETVEKSPEPVAPMIIGNWEPYRSKKDLDSFLKKLAQNNYSAASPVYLALPLTMIPDHAANLKFQGIVIGSNAMHNAAEGSFTAGVAIDILKKTDAHFVLLRADQQQTPYSTIHHNILALLDRDITPILCIGESVEQYRQDQTMEVLTTTIHECLQGISDDRLSRIPLIYASPWLSEQGLSSLRDNLNKSCEVCRQVLKEQFGEEQRMRVLSIIPHFVSDFSTYLKGTECDGFCFFDLATHADHFLKILAAITQERATPP